MASALNTYPPTAESILPSLFGKPTRRSYRAAVKAIILDVKARNSLSDQELADLLGCHKETIENAQEEANSLDVVTLLNVAYAFGEEAIDPVRQLYLCKPAAPLTRDGRFARTQRPGWTVWGNQTDKFTPAEAA